ncbi:guanitoxin biosynthesis heme-dependent pre-guanitoxin N-hydroxylase GntA [Streptomyces sp. NPDC056411]|uniref:guanitoxin biosynthesis heme-dependent pre-guanitoxin N-hydroxylase GntA n=1 Tax=Streptomyces sp. NPDC056411 TaxID=3345813 RepID=UPI0035E2A7A2
MTEGHTMTEPHTDRASDTDTGPGPSGTDVAGSAAAAAVRAELERFLQTREFSCLGARAALKRHTLTHHHYRRMGDAATAADNHRDLLAYVRTVRPQLSDQSFRTFVATFDEPGRLDEAAHERLLWQHLQLMHDIDSRTHGVEAGASSDPGRPDFGFHTGGHAFFVVGMHSGASRASRRFTSPAIVFNSLTQFVLLGKKFSTMQAAIRRRESLHNGSVNPSFTRYEYEQPARHFAGRLTEEDWTCPYISRHPHPQPGGPHPTAAEDATEGHAPHHGSTPRRL